jgi:thiol-disulfide isomerase/thioredoxin
MSGINNMIKQTKDLINYVDLDWKTASIGLVITALVVGVTYYWFVIRKKQLESFEYNINREPSDSSDSSKNAELLFFYTDWCPWCKRSKPEWEEMRTEYEGKTINGYVVKFKEIDCTNETEETERLIDKYKIEGYPTLKLLKDGNVIEFDAKVSKENMVEFLNTML